MRSSIKNISRNTVTLLQFNMRFAPVLLLFLKFTSAVDHVEDDDDDEDDTEEDEVGVRSAFDMFTRRLPGFLMLATHGNDTGTILGTWSTNAIASTVFEFYQEESVIGSGHDFGGWITGSQSYFMHVQQQMPFKALESSMYSSAAAGTHEARKDIDLLMTKLWTSAILRDNIVTAFGFILNQPNNLLPTDLYASLTILYNVIRLRRIHTLDVLPVLKRMSFSPPQEQFIVLFEELHRHAPAHLKSIIGVWVDALTEHRVDLNPIIRPGGGPSEVDFLASLEPSVLKVLEESTFFKRETTERASTTLKVLMGSLFSYVFAGLYDRSIELTQPLFALILLHLPLDQIVPEKDETERFLVDALRLNAIKNWDEVVRTLSDADVLDPFRLVTTVLQGIADNKHTDQQIRHDSLYILPYIKVSTSTYASENYAIMSEVVGSPSIKFKLLLDHITRLTYSQDMMSLKDRLLDYIRNGYIGMDSAITGFIRYDYTTPYDVIIAILTRIQRRLPNLSGDMLGTVRALRVQLVFHKILSQTTRRFPGNVIYLPSLLDAFYDPGLPVKVRRISKSLSELLDEERIDWESLIGDMTVAFCTSPRQCFLAILKKAIDKNVVVDGRIAKLAEKLFKILDENGNVRSTSEPSKCEPVTPTIAAPPAQVNINVSKSESMMPTAQTPTVVEVNTTKVPEHLRFSSPSAASITVAEDASTKVAPTFLPYDVLNATLQSNTSLLNIIYKDPQLQKVFEILENNTIPELHQVIRRFPNMTGANALLILLEYFLHYIPAEFNTTLVGKIVDYIDILVANYGLSRTKYLSKVYPLPPPDTEFPTINPSIFYFTANFEQRESLLPYTTPFTPKDILMKPIRDFITQPDLLSILGEDFKPSEYPTKFLLLCAILEKAIAIHVVQEDVYLHELLTSYLDFLKHEAEKTKPSVNWMCVLDALPHPKDDHEYKYFTTLRKFLISTDIDMYIKSFEVRRYPTRGQLLQNCLKYLLSIKPIKERTELIAAIKYFVDRVYLDGFGAKPVEYVIIKEHITRRTVDLQKAFQAIALSQLDQKARKALKGVYKFFEKEFQPPIHLANYDLLKHKTKGEWLKAYFTYLAHHPAVSRKARDNISAVIPYILLTGPGAENVD